MITTESPTAERTIDQDIAESEAIIAAQEAEAFNKDRAAAEAKAQAQAWSQIQTDAAEVLRGSAMEAAWRTETDDTGQVLRPWLSPSHDRYGQYAKMNRQLSQNHPDVPLAARMQAIDAAMGTTGTILSSKEREVAEKMYRGDPDPVGRFARAKAVKAAPAPDPIERNRRMLTKLFRDGESTRHTNQTEEQRRGLEDTALHIRLRSIHAMQQHLAANDGVYRVPGSWHPSGSLKVSGERGERVERDRAAQWQKHLAQLLG